MRVRMVLDETAREDEPIFVISKAAELAGMHPQTLRQYDRIGLVSPRRTSGRGRRYSKRDVVRLVQIQKLSQEEGINLAGIKRIFDLEDHVRTLEARVELLTAQVNPGSRIFTAGTEGDVVSRRRGAAFLRRGAESGAGRTGHTGHAEARRRNGRKGPLQLTARVEEISRTEFEESHLGLEFGPNGEIIRHSSGKGNAVIIWTPDE